MKSNALCLNMIVKNEVANLERCLGSVAEYIDSWVICDTGSSDGTQEFIKSFFADKKLPGELHGTPFENFEQARNAALDFAYASPLPYDYLLLADADMELVVEDKSFRDHLSGPGYRLLQRTDSRLAYWNTRLVHRNVGARYHGVTHEYLDVTAGVTDLHGVWYKDHASGANRIDKFERDVRLLLEGLEKEPNNSRYWFYLAQSYRDAGQLAKAVEAYTKRMEMGGWDEEVWYARLQLARCWRQLGDEGRFLREALTAFDQRPQRAEPLYDLARHYREKGMNDASSLFSEAGLPLELPKTDILFVEEYAYVTGLKEEYSISANYSRDPVRKNRGFATCDWLALSRETPAASRNLARSNLFFYVEPASAVMPSFAARAVGAVPPDGFLPLSASVARLADELLVIQQCVNVAMTGDGRLMTPGDEPERTRNFLLRLDDHLEAKSLAEIQPPADMPQPSFAGAVRFQDFRPFVWRGAMFGTATTRALNPEGREQQILARIENLEGGDACRLVDWRVLHPEGHPQDETGWMPWVQDDTLRFVQLGNALRILDADARTIIESPLPIAADHFTGSSQLIPFDGGWLAVARQEHLRDRTRLYFHRFVWFDQVSLSRISLPFFLQNQGAERVGGIAWHPDGARLLISFGTSDANCRIATVDANDVRSLLGAVAAEFVFADIKQTSALLAKHGLSPRDAPSGAPTPADPAAPPATRKFNLASLRLDHVARPFWIPKPPAAPGDGLSKPPPSDWVPSAPAAGTELMVAGLKKRLGSELDLINLKVNDPGPPDGDKRPLIVWMHHDVNQEWVQWCKDKALVDRVNRFVFVSYWQRDRYLSTFDLPPERCFVLRNATEVSPRLRPWDSGPIWRFAYTSTPFRGLSVLLDAWQHINSSNAELHIWSSMKLYRGDDSPYHHLYERAQSMPGVFYHGIVPNPELQVALQNIHFLAYPSTFSETSCLAVIEAMAAGCRIIVPSLGALPETTSGYARVYPEHRDPAAHAEIFRRILEDEMNGPWAGCPALSAAQQRHCLATFAWSGRLDEWRRLISSACGQSHAGPADGAPRSDQLAALVSGNGRQDVLAAVRALASGGVFVEVGTFKAEFAEQIASFGEPAKLYCVDPYQGYQNYEDTISTREDLDVVFEEARARMSRFGPRVEFIRAFSADAAEQFQDNSLDFVYREPRIIGCGAALCESRS